MNTSIKSGLESDIQLAMLGYNRTSDNATGLQDFMPHNLTESELEDYLTKNIGARYRSVTESVVVSIVYSVIFVTGVIGNVSTCIVIIRNSYMHTATNYYLFTLAISDVLTLILGLPPELYTIWEAYPWRLGEPYCMLKTFLTEMTSSASILTITAFTVERYVAICHPLRAQTMSSLPRAVKIIISIWILSCLSSLPYPIHARTFYYLNYPNTTIPIDVSLICSIRTDWMVRMRYVFQISVFLLFVLPMGLITWLYILIGITLRRSAGLTRQCSDVSGSPQTQARRTVLKMLVAVVVAFFLCWAPFHAQRLMTAYIEEGEWTNKLIEIQNYLFYISGFLYFVSATVNPILYNLMSKKYRLAFKETLCKCHCRTSQSSAPLGRNRTWFFSERSTSYYSVGGKSTLKLQSDRQLSSKYNRAGSHGRNAELLQNIKPKETSEFYNGKKDEVICKETLKFTDNDHGQKHGNVDESDQAVSAEVATNGGVVSSRESSSSAVSSPGTMAARLNDELELVELNKP